MLIRGNDLQPSTKREVLSAFMYRLTREAITANPKLYQRTMAGRVMNLQWTTDARWLEQHAFYITKAGRLARNRHHCEPAFMAED